MTLIRQIKAWGLPLSVLLLAVVLQFGSDALPYDRNAIGGGELWRLFSGHFVHLGGMHLLLNAAGLLLVWTLVGDAFSTRHWLIIATCSLLSMDLGFWFLLPWLEWYVGLSGLLHGLMAAGVAGLWHERRIEALAIAAILVGKLGYEIALGSLPGSAAIAGGAVITEAHLLGGIGGFLAGVLLVIRVRSQASL